jgi:dihydropteroate synthase
MTTRLDAFFDGPRRSWVMGIVNATPDSFSGDGVLASATIADDRWLDMALDHAMSLVDEGADILDIGGESTRPGAVPVSADQELARVIPLIERIRARCDIALSIDTSKAIVAANAVAAGADLINDVWALAHDPDMAMQAARLGVPVVLMHNSSSPQAIIRTPIIGAQYVGDVDGDILTRVIDDLRARIAFAIAAGIAPARILVDPGIGFGKTLAQNLALINRMDELKVLGCPILSGPSRKGFIGKVLDLPVDDRLEGTAATVALSIARGARMVRVHDVRAMARIARMMDAMVRS